MSNRKNSQKFFNNSTLVGYGSSGVAVNTSAIDTSAGTTLVFTGQLDAAAAAAGGVKVGGMYRNGSALMVRVS